MSVEEERGGVRADSLSLNLVVVIGLAFSQVWSGGSDASKSDDDHGEVRDEHTAVVDKGCAVWRWVGGGWKCQVEQRKGKARTPPSLL